MTSETLRVTASSADWLELADGGLLLCEPSFLDVKFAWSCFEEIQAMTPWQQQRGVFGHPQPRLTAAYGDDGLTYRYSGTDNPALPWTRTLLEIKARIEAVAGRYNFCLLNRYRSGADSVGWHADDERGLGNIIGSLSLGATRTFRIRHNASRATRSFEVAHGTLIVMAGTMQQFWQHEVPITTAQVGERINLTFRGLDPAAS